MADTIAKLKFQADSKHIKSATKELIKLDKASKAAASSVNKLTSAFSNQKKALQGDTKALQEASNNRKAFNKALEDSKQKASQASASVAKSTQETKKSSNATKQNKEETKKLNAIKKAEIKAYQEEARRKAKATQTTKKDTQAKERNVRATKKVVTANDKLVTSFKNASTATATLQGPLNGVSGRLSFIATGLQRVGPAGLIAGAGLAGAAFAAKTALDAFATFEAEVLQLEAMLQATGNQVGFTSQELQDMANEIGMATLASAGDIRQAQGIILTFSQITGEQFARTTDLSQDLAQVMGVTAQSAAKTLGKALQDPTNNLASLSRAGITFTQSEKDILETLILTNRGIEAQDLILTKLEKRIGSAGEGAGKGLAGAFDGLTEQVDLLRIAFAKESGLADFFESKVQSLTAFAKSLTDTLNATAEVDAATSTGVDTSQRRANRGGGQGGTTASIFENLRTAIFGGGTEDDRSRAEIRTGRTSSAASQAVTSTQLTTTPTSTTPISPTSTTNVTAISSVLRPEEVIANRERINAIRKQDLELLNSKIQFADAETNIFKEKARLQEGIAVEQASLEFIRASGKITSDQELAEQEKEFLISKLEEEFNIKIEKAKMTNLAIEEEELRHKAALGDIDAQAALGRRDFEKKTEREKTRVMFGEFSKRLSAAATLNKGMFKISQAAAIADTVVNTISAAQLMHKQYGFPKGTALGAIELAAGAARVKQIKAQTFGGGGSIGSSGGGGGSVSGASAAESAPVETLTQDTLAPEPSVINLSIDNSIDPEGARRIVEALNDAMTDGLEINALVS